MYHLTLKDKELDKFLPLEIIQDKQKMKYYIIDMHKNKREIESFLDDSLITYPQNLCTTLLEEIFKQPQENIQDFLDGLSRVIKLLNQALEDEGIAF